MNNIMDIRQYSPLKGEKFFFDTNIWVYLYGMGSERTVGTYNRERAKEYGRFLRKAIESKSSILISSLVLAEFFNTQIRQEFNLLRRDNLSLDFKRDFRHTDQYKDAVSTVREKIELEIMTFAEKIDDKFSSTSIDELFEEIENSDFNDNYLIVMANLENFKIVTHDSDFVFSRRTPITILTANKRILEGR